MVGKFIFTHHTHTHTHTHQTGTPVYVFDMEYIRSKSAQLLFCDRVVELYTILANRESKERCLNLTKGKLHIDIMPSSNSVNQFEFNLSRTDVASDEDATGTTTTTTTTTTTSPKKKNGFHGLSVDVTPSLPPPSSSSWNVICTKLSMYAKTDSGRNAWIQALKKNVCL
jgi:hypothetical protein